MRRLGSFVPMTTALAFTLLACFVPSARAATARGAQKVQHVVIVVQEGRSYDNLFCNYPGANSRCFRHAIALEANCQIADTFEDFKRDERSGNFGREKANCPGYTRPEYAHVPPSEIKKYWSIANQYVLGDDTFSSTGNPTFEAHQYLIAAQAAGTRDEPFGSVPPDGCLYLAKVHQLVGGPIPACFNYATLGAELDNAGLTWSYYHAGNPNVPVWDAYGWIHGSASGSGYGSHVFSPSAQFLSDVANGKLASVTWVTPELANSDLSGSLSAGGPDWVASVVNAIGESTFWDSTAILITWSGFGGWYDHVPPPLLDSEGLGFRVPMLIVSPYAKAGYVSHVQYESASLLRFAEDLFALQPLAAADSRANDPARDAFNFNQAPRPFKPI